jgi:HK97 family phage portal protein
MSESTGVRRMFSRLPFLNRWNGANGSEDEAKGLTIIHDGSEFVPVPFDDPTQIRYDWARNVGSDGSEFKSSVLAAPLDFLMRTFPEAPPIVKRRKQGLWEEEPDHALTRLLENPNPFYGGEELWMTTVLDLAFGNAYWIKIRNRFGDVVELWWVPRYSMKAKWPEDGKTFISHYEYSVGRGTKDIAVRDVVHLRYGMDPHNSRYGLSRLGSLMREVGVDEQAASFTETVLKNLGVIGVVISPDGAGPVSKEALKETKDYITAQFTGNRRASPLALGAATKVQLLNYQMQGFDVSPIRDVSEERVCAVLGIPAAVVGFGTGLQQTKVGATMKELRQLTWTGGIIPLQRNVGKQIQRQLLSEFEADKRQLARFTFDDTQVRALWEDQNEKHMRVREDYKAELIDRAEARRETGRSARSEDENVYYSAPTAGATTTTGNPPPKTPPGQATEDAANADNTGQGT